MLHLPDPPSSPMLPDHTPENPPDPLAVAQAESGYRLETVLEQDTLRVQVHGKFEDQAVRVAYLREAVALAKARGCRKLLLIDRKFKDSPASPEALGELARLFAAEAPHFDRIAVVEPTPAFVTALEHGEIAARSVGLNLRVFADSAAAERWLHYAHTDEE